MRREIKEIIWMSIIGIIFGINIIVPNIYKMIPKIQEFVWFAWALFGIGGILVLLSLATLRIKKTHQVIDQGIYSILRHPMYVGGMVFFLSHMFFFQHWLIILDSWIAIISIYMTILLEEQRLIEQFGSDYLKYMQKVPRINFLLGVLRRKYR